MKKIVLMIAVLIFTASCTKKAETQDESSKMSMSQAIVSNFKATLESGEATKSNAKMSYQKITRFAVSLSAEQIEDIVQGAEDEIGAQGLNDSENLGQILKAAIKGSQKAIVSAGVSAASDKIDVIELIAAAAEVSLHGHDGLTSDEKLNTLSEVSKEIFSNLDEVGFTSSEISQVSKEVMNSLVRNMDEAGLSDAEMEMAFSSVTEAAVEALDEISISGVDASKLPEMIRYMTTGAVAGLGEIYGISEEDLSVYIKEITEGTASGLDGITMDGFDGNDMGDVAQQISAGAASALDDISIAGYDSTDYSKLFTEIAEGTSLGLSEVKDSYNFDSTAVMSEIASGTALGIKDIDGYTISDNDLETALSSGFTSAKEEAAAEGVTIEPPADLNSSIDEGQAATDPYVGANEFPSSEEPAPADEGTMPPPDSGSGDGESTPPPDSGSGGGETSPPPTATERPANTYGIYEPNLGTIVTADSYWQMSCVPGENVKVGIGEQYAQLDYGTTCPQNGILGGQFGALTSFGAIETDAPVQLTFINMGGIQYFDTTLSSKTHSYMFVKGP